jgi:hypothetical protein
VTNAPFAIEYFKHAVAGLTTNEDIAGDKKELTLRYFRQVEALLDKYAPELAKTICSMFSELNKRARDTAVAGTPADVQEPAAKLRRLVE